MTGWAIATVGLTGFILNVIYTHPESLFPAYIVFLMIPVLICRLFGLNRAVGCLAIAISLILGSGLAGNFRIALLIVLLGAFLNGLVILINNGMPVQNRITPEGIHIPMNNKTKFYYLCDLSILGRCSIGDVLIIMGLWTNFFMSRV